MGSAYTKTNYRGAEYTPDELRELYRYNDAVGGYFWAGIGAVILLFTLANVLAKLLSGRRRRAAARAVWTKGQPRLEIDAHAGEVSFSHVDSFFVAIFRKISVNQPRIIEKLYLGSVGHLLLLLAYIGLNFGLVFGGSQRDIDWCVGS
jgi:hypothetical protein